MGAMKRELTLLLESQTHLSGSGPGPGPGSLGRTRSSSKRLKVCDGIDDQSGHRAALESTSIGSSVSISEDAREKSPNTAASSGVAASGNDSSADLSKQFNGSCLDPETGGSVFNESTSLNPEVVTESTKEEFKTATPRIMFKKKTKKGSLSITELLETGLLDGLSVTYKGYGIHGVIKDSGILCSCASCKGQSVVSPSKFERHVCKVYRNAAQYIYLENGKSISKVLKECRGTSLEKLEVKIRNAVGPLPEKCISKVVKGCRGTSLDKLEKPIPNAVGSLPGKSISKVLKERRGTSLEKILNAVGPPPEKNISKELKECRGTSLDKLEETIQKAVGPLPGKSISKVPKGCGGTSLDKLETIINAVDSPPEKNISKELKESTGTSLEKLEETIQKAVGPLHEKSISKAPKGCGGTSLDKLETIINAVDSPPEKNISKELKECRGTSLDKLEETIQKAVGPLPEKSISKAPKGCGGTSLDKLEKTIQNPFGPLPEKIISKELKECRGTSLEKVEETNQNAVDPPHEKNISQGLRECSGTSLDRLEATSCNAVGSRPEKVPMICHDCKGSLSTLPGLTVDSLCCSCIKLRNSLANPAQTITTRTRSSKPVLTPVSYEGASTSNTSKSKNEGKITKRFHPLHKLVFDEGGLPDGTELAYYGSGQKLLEGYKKGFGIFCFCCNLEVSPSVFEAHAGWASRRKPYQYIYTSNGVSLHELSLSLSKVRKFAAEDNDDVCIICADGGNLLLCDGCPRAFHKECASLTSVPDGSWYCKYCHNMYGKDKYLAYSANAVAAGRVSGVDSIEQITKRCIRIVKNPEAGGNACVLCRGYDNHKSEFGPSSVMLCDQCGMEYHIGCLKDHKMVDLKELPKGKWFCCMDCRRIHSTLQKLVVNGAECLPNSLLNIIKKKDEEKGSDGRQLDIRWRLLSGKMTSPEAKLLLSDTVSIFHCCFDPIIDPTTGQDLIPCMVYCRNTKGYDFEGMYCAILTVNSTIVTAGVLRILGQGIAEIPLVATTKDNHGKGYFQTLFSCIERLLAFSKVKTLVLPAADEAISIWTDKFGFKKILPYQLSNYHKNGFRLMTFQGTSMLQKSVPKCQIVPACRE